MNDVVAHEPQPRNTTTISTNTRQITNVQMYLKIAFRQHIIERNTYQPVQATELCFRHRSEAMELNTSKVNDVTA